MTKRKRPGAAPRATFIPTGEFTAYPNNDRDGVLFRQRDGRTKDAFPAPFVDMLVAKGLAHAVQPVEAVEPSPPETARTAAPPPPAEPSPPAADSERPPGAAGGEPDAAGSPAE